VKQITTERILSTSNYYTAILSSQHTLMGQEPQGHILLRTNQAALSVSATQTSRQVQRISFLKKGYWTKTPLFPTDFFSKTMASSEEKDEDSIVLVGPPKKFPAVPFSEMFGDAIPQMALDVEKNVAHQSPELNSPAYALVQALQHHTRESSYIDAILMNPDSLKYAYNPLGTTVSHFALLFQKEAKKKKKKKKLTVCVLWFHCFVVCILSNVNVKRL
jgi:hypothetical protein